VYDLLDYGREGQLSQAPVNYPLPTALRSVCSSLSLIPCGFSHVCASFSGVRNWSLQVVTR